MLSLDIMSRIEKKGLKNNRGLYKSRVKTDLFLSQHATHLETRSASEIRSCASWSLSSMNCQDSWSTSTQLAWIFAVSLQNFTIFYNSHNFLGIFVLHYSEYILLITFFPLTVMKVLIGWRWNDMKANFRKI